MSVRSSVLSTSGRGIPPRVLAPAVLATAGCLALAMRPVGWTGTWITLVVGLAGFIDAEPGPRAVSRSAWCATFAAGAGAFLLARLSIAGRVLPATASAGAIAANIAAAVAEEAFFRRFLYGRLSSRGTAIAVGASALAFAAVHLPFYGVAVLPLDLAAGALLSCQRAAAGTWTVPAATHALANLLAMV